MRQKSVSIKKSDISKRWVMVDANEVPLGRLASKISTILRGKNKVEFTPHLDIGDNVVVINASKVKLTGKKLTDKKYYRHSGMVGKQKVVHISKLMENRPEEVIIKAVKGMLPGNRLSRKLLKNLRVFAGSDHTLKSQKPVEGKVFSNGVNIVGR